MKHLTINPYYLAVLQAWQSELQKFLGSEEQDLETLLSNDCIKELSMSRLKEILDDTLSQRNIIVENDLYSIQPDSGSSRDYHLELKMGGQIIYSSNIPLNRKVAFEHAYIVKRLFEQIARGLYDATHDAATSTELKNLLNPYKEEMDSMEKISRLNLKQFLNPQNEPVNTTSTIESAKEEPAVQHETPLTNQASQEVLPVEEVSSKSMDLLDLDDAVDYDLEDDDFEEDALIVSTEASTTLENTDLSSYSNILPAFDEDSQDILLPDFDLVQMPSVVETFNFDVINSELNAVFKAVSAVDRDALKQVKSTIWELELKQEEEPLEDSDFMYLVQNVLSIESDEQAVLKWQLNLVRALLDR